MKLLIDDANLDAIEAILALYPIDGVTTNPTILAKAGENPKERLIKIRKLIGDDLDLHCQVVASSKEDMKDQARKLVKVLGDNTYIKIPSSGEGFKAMEELSKERIKVTATGIYSPLQGFLAAKAGAKYLAPYVNRIDNLGYDGLAVARKIQNILEANDFDTEILAASFKNSNQVLDLVERGVGALTLGTAVFDSLVNDRNVDFAIKTFEDDFAKILDEGQTFSNIL
ncbi:transaldolase family protein [uncultured Anaerococcus sp.]|uniref:transaldolase family protein n=1 Tax=uncultured Anaerococcus sp. TaxID=293428 RepID=UPI0025DC78EA|nr:transaldolase family protein [uncultured Anaerococcus sp.]